MIKLIVFDLDGVLVEAKNIHFEALNKALDKYAIEWNEHLSTYDGLKTNQKLEMLHKNKGLPKEKFEEVWNNKQKYTLEALANLKKDDVLYSTIQNLSLEGYKLAVCSNSIRKTVLTVLSKLGIIECSKQ
jgi:beta-phosphoglucomutase